MANTNTAAAAKQTYIAQTPYGVFKRNSTRAYLYCVARADGWHQFSMSLAAAQRELRYQQKPRPPGGHHNRDSRISAEHRRILVHMARTTKEPR